MGSVPRSRVSPQLWTIPARAEIQTHNLELQVSGTDNGKRARTQLQEVKGLFINNDKLNKQKQPRRVKTNWQAGQGRTQDIRRPNIWQRTHTELQTQGDFKGSK